MSFEDRTLTERVASLRDAFDRSFAAQPVTSTDELDNLLGVRIAGDAFALRLSEIAGLFVDRKLLALPSPVPELLGLTGLRGALLPVYNLAALLGYTLKVASPRWLVVVGAGPQLGLAFEQFDGHMQVPRSQMGKAALDVPRSHVVETAHIHGEARALVSMPSIVDAVARKVSSTRTGREP